MRFTVSMHEIEPKALKINHKHKPQHGRPKRAELPDVSVNIGVQSINTERASFNMYETGLTNIMALNLWGCLIN